MVSENIYRYEMFIMNIVLGEEMDGVQFCSNYRSTGAVDKMLDCSLSTTNYYI